MDEEKVKLRAEVNSLLARVGLLENRSAFDALVLRVGLLENPSAFDALVARVGLLENPPAPKKKSPPAWMMKKERQKKKAVGSPVSDTSAVDSPISSSAVSIEAQA